MNIDYNGIAKKQINMPGEILVWAGIQEIPKDERVLKPISWLLKGLSIALLAYVFFLLAYYIAPEEGRSLEALPPDIQTRIFGLTIGGVVFWVFRMALPQIFRKNDYTVYAVSNRRAFIIEKKDDKERVRIYGAGEIRNFSSRKTGGNRGDIFFVDVIRGVGALGSRQREQLTWEGFSNLRDFGGAKSALEKLQSGFKAPVVITRADLKLQIGLPGNWSIYGKWVEKDQRDSILFSVISCLLLDGRKPFLENPSLPKDLLKWNTMVLFLRRDPDARKDVAQIPFFTIVVEVATNKKDIEKFENKNEEAAVNFDGFVKDGKSFTNILSSIINIVEYQNLLKGDKGIICLNERAQKVGFANGMENYQMHGAINLLGKELMFKQVYSYQKNTQVSGKNLHLRFTYISSGPDKLFKTQEETLDKIVLSSKLIVPEAKKKDEKAADGGDKK